MIDAHVHLDRARTAKDVYWERARMSVREIMGAPLRLKQSAMGKLHMGLAYQPDELLARMRGVLEDKVAAGEKEVWACIDTSTDIGSVAIDAALELKAEFAGRLELKVGDYPIFGFKTRRSDREQLVREVAPRADFFVGLPERDECEGHESVGFRGHIETILGLGHEFHLPVHMHLDQANVPTENGTETVIEALRWLHSPTVPGMDGPTVWAVHVISPSCYDEVRYRRLVDGLLECNVGVIVCPHAGISMRQIRSVSSPVHNCLARVRTLAAAGVPLRFGTDNIDDIFVGMPRPDLGREIEIIGSIERYYVPVIWMKIARGEALDDVDRDLIQRTLDQDREVWSQYSA